jgi:hypothetical protein
MSVHENIVNAVAEELLLSYNAAGRVVPTTAPIIAASLADAVDFKDEAMVHAAFRKARDTEAIPLQGTLKGIVDSMRRLETSEAMIEYSDPRWPWLPKSDLMRKTNFDLAVMRLCIAQGEKEYKRYVDCTLTRYDEHRRVVYANPKAAREFLLEKQEHIKHLYEKYLLDLPEYRSNPKVGNGGFPKGAKLNYGLLPPEVYQFREMLEKEVADYEWGNYA